MIPSLSPAAKARDAVFYRENAATGRTHGLSEQLDPARQDSPGHDRGGHAVPGSGAAHGPANIHFVAREWNGFEDL